MARLTSMPPAVKTTARVAWMNFSGFAVEGFDAHHCTVVGHQGGDGAIDADFDAVFTRGAFKLLERDEVDVDAVGGGRHAFPFKQAATRRRRVHGNPFRACLVVHPVDAFGPLFGHGAQKLRVAGHLLAAHDEFNDAINIVRVAWVCPLSCFGLLMAAEVGENGRMLRIAAGFGIALEHNHLVAHLREPYRGVACRLRRTPLQ